MFRVRLDTSIEALEAFDDIAYSLKKRNIYVETNLFTGFISRHQNQLFIEQGHF